MVGSVVAGARGRAGFSFCFRVLRNVILTSVIAAGAQAAEAPLAIFGTGEVRSDDLVRLTKWTATLARHRAEADVAVTPCRPAQGRCHYTAWLAFLSTQRGRDRLSQIEAVNRYVNRKRYVLDDLNYGMSDYWATPAEFLARNGDCEDYAIAKFLSLRALGIPNRDLRVVILDDRLRRQAHAVVVVRHGGRLLVLDNQSAGAVPAETITHYAPIYSMNERSWWLHRRVGAAAGL